jgi:hypothetical protein
MNNEPRATLDPHPGRPHVLLTCPDCDGRGSYETDNGWRLCYCDGRGYYEICSICRQPMGNARRKWKREQAAL